MFVRHGAKGKLPIRARTRKPESRNRELSNASELDAYRKGRETSRTSRYFKNAARAFNGGISSTTSSIEAASMSGCIKRAVNGDEPSERRIAGHNRLRAAVVQTSRVDATST